MPTIIQKIDLERGLLWLLIRVEGIVTGMRCLGESPKKVKPAFNWLERCLFIPFDSLHSLQSEMFQINSAQDREARNFTSTGVINLNTTCRKIFRYLKNLCKTKVVARREGRWTRVSKDGNFFLLLFSFGYLNAPQLLYIKSFSKNYRRKTNLSQDLFLLVMTNLLNWPLTLLRWLALGSWFLLFDLTCGFPWKKLLKYISAVLETSEKK